MKRCNIHVPGFSGIYVMVDDDNKIIYKIDTDNYLTFHDYTEERFNDYSQDKQRYLISNSNNFLDKFIDYKIKIITSEEFKQVIKGD